MEPIKTDMQDIQTQNNLNQLRMKTCNVKNSEEKLLEVWAPRQRRY